MAWCYMLAGRSDEVHAILDAAPAGPDVDVVRYSLALEEPGGAAARPEPTGGLLDGMLYGVDYFCGRLAELTEDPPSPWTRVAMDTGRMGALRATGRTAEALQQYEATQRRSFFAGVVDAVVGPDVLLDAGRIDEARAALARGGKFIQANGSPILTGLHHTVAAKLALRADRDAASATALLERVDRSAANDYSLVREFAQTWRGLAALIEGDEDSALSSLRPAVATMRAGHRILELPTAAVYLAEAEWRAGNPDAADHAADIALEAARQQGSNHVLLQALTDFPAVVARRIDAEPHADSAWHTIGRALTAQGVTIGTRIPTSIELVEFGSPAIILNGQQVRPSLAKCYELLGFLAARNRAPASRDELLDALFDARADESARSYLRKTIIGVRRLLPPDALGVAPDGRVAAILATDTACAESSAGWLTFEATLQADPNQPQLSTSHIPHSSGFAPAASCPAFAGGLRIRFAI